MTVFSDKEFVSGCINGERQMIDALVEMYYSRVYSLSVKVLQNEDEAKDITQDTFIRVFDKLRQFKFKSSLKTWILSITYNLCMNRLSMCKNRQHVVFDLEILNIEDMNAGEEAFLHEQKIEVIERALEVLNSEEKLLIELYYLNDCSIRDMALILQKSETAVKTGLFRARQKLKSMVLKQENYEFN